MSSVECYNGIVNNVKEQHCSGETWEMCVEIFRHEKSGCWQLTSNRERDKRETEINGVGSVCVGETQREGGNLEQC